MSKQYSTLIKNSVFLGVLFLFIGFLISGCISDELEELPFFTISYEKTNFGKQYGTVELVGRINGLNNDELEDHGFVWSNSPETIRDFPENGEVISKGTQSTEGEFFENFSLNEKDTFYFRAYGKLKDRFIYSSFIDKIFLGGLLEIKEIDIFNNEANILGSIRGLNFNGIFEEYGLIYSSSNSNPEYNTDEIVKQNDTLFSDLPVFRDTIIGLDFNTKYYCRIYGKSNNRIFQGSVKEFQILDGWKRKLNFVSNAEGAFGFSKDGKGLIGFGATKTDASEAGNFYDLYEFSDNSNVGTWRRLDMNPDQDLIATLTNSVAFILNGVIYAGLGNYFNITNQGSKDEFTDVIHRFDENTNRWEQFSSFMGDPRTDAVAFVIGDKAYIGAGRDSMEFNDFYEFDPSGSNHWRQVDSMPQINENGMVNLNEAGRKGALAFVPNGSSVGYVGIGNNGGFYLNDIWQFDPNATAGNQWTLETHLPDEGRENAVGFTIGNKAYLIAGFTSERGYLNDTWEYDFGTQEWYRGTPFTGEGGRQSAIGFSIGEKGYFGMGRARAIKDNVFKPCLMNDFWEYIPRQ